jgi:hypothetical protein
MKTLFLSLLLLVRGREAQITYEGRDPDTHREIWTLELDTAVFVGVYKEELVDYSKTGVFKYNDFQGHESCFKPYTPQSK